MDEHNNQPAIVDIGDTRSFQKNLDAAEDKDRYQQDYKHAQRKTPAQGFQTGLPVPVRLVLQNGLVLFFHTRFTAL